MAQARRAEGLVSRRAKSQEAPNIRFFGGTLNIVIEMCAGALL